MTTLASHGTIIQIGDGGSPTEVFAAIADLGDITPPNVTMETHDASTQTSDWAVFIPGLKRMEPVTFAMNFDPSEATHDHLTGLIKDSLDQTKRNFRIVFTDPGSTTWEFAAYVTGVVPEAPVDGVLTAEVTLQPTGEPAPQFGV
jgi:hypothetical protein